MAGGLLRTMHVTSHGPVTVTVWPPPAPSTPTLWYHTHCLLLSGSLGTVELSQNNQPILGPLELSHHTQFHATVPTPTTWPPAPAGVRHNPMWMHNLTPHDLLSVLEGNRPLPFLEKVWGHSPFRALHAGGPGPTPTCFLPTAAGKGGGLGPALPLAGSLAAPLRLRKEI